MQEAIFEVISRGVTLDKSERYTEALVCYQEGIQLLINALKKESGDKAVYYRNKITEYMARAEKIKKIVDEQKELGKFNETIEIKSDTAGYSYEKIFGRFLDGDVKEVLVEDPYIRMWHQCQNFVRFCELVLKKCKSIAKIKLVTGSHPGEQREWLAQIRTSLLQHNVMLFVDFSDTLHDRKITLNTGWIIKIGRGLDYFKPPEQKLGIGAFDMDLRKCHETTVNIYHTKSVKQL